MKCVALLRGINVGGNNKVSMPQLKASLEKAGFNNVSTYINSGNVLLDSPLPSLDLATSAIESVIEKASGFSIHVIVLSHEDFSNIAKSIPEGWTNDTAMRCDIMFLWKDVDRPEIMESLIIKPGIDRVLYVPGALIWSIDRNNVTRSGMLKLIGTGLYKRMTIRNCNTVRKLEALSLAPSGE